MTATRAASHTPGPWKVIQHNHADGDLWLSVNQDSDMPHWVAEIKYLATDNEQQWANARLIAAAPEMFVALQHCVEFLAIGQYNGIADIARAALTKAGGGEKR